MRVSDRSRLLAAALLVGAGPQAQALTQLLYDAEPNDAPHQAIDLDPPAGKDSVRVLGELEGSDQDAYRLVIDEDLAARRFNLSLTGRAGALTRVDVLDFTELADGRGRIPDALDRRPANLMTLATNDGMRAEQVDRLLFAPGVYVLGVSHSGGEGAYTLTLAQHDDYGITVLDGKRGTADDPQSVSPGGDFHAWTQGETWYRFEIDERAAEWAYTVSIHTALGRPSTLELYGEGDEPLLTLDSPGGTPVERPGLELAPGQYRIRTEQQVAGTQIIALPRSAPASQDGRETEPNDSVPTPIPFGETISGRFDASDSDWLLFNVDDEAAERRYDLELRAGPESMVEVCLMRRSMNLSDCTRGTDGLTAIRSLGLTPGEYRLRLSERGPEGADWQLSWIDRGERTVGEEIEPNDSHEHPVALHERGFGRGSFDGGRDYDHWRLNVSGEPQLWRLQIQGDDLFELTLKGGGGQVLASERAGNDTRIRLDNLFLMPGEYLINALGDSGDYILRAQPLGPPPPGMEIEPNDEIADARLMRFDQEYFGTLAEEGDDDRYRFTLMGPERVRLTVQPPVDGGIRGYLGVGSDAKTLADIRNANKPGEPLVWEMFLPADDYHLWLRAGELSDAEYTVRLERLEWLAPVVDREPNDYLGDASPFPADGWLRGRVGTASPTGDWYRLPPVDQTTPLGWAEPAGTRIEVVEIAAPGEDLVTFDREADLHRVTLDPDSTYFLRVEGNGEYELDLSPLAGAEAPGAPPELALSLESSGIQAFSEWAQSLQGEITLRNPDAAAREIELLTHLTDARWRIEGLPDRVRLAAGEQRDFAFSVHVAPDAVVEPAGRLSVVARSGLAASPAAAVTVATSNENAPVRPTFYWPVPEALRGGLNAAAPRFGAEPVASPGLDEDQVKEMERLFDGLARYGRWTGLSIPTRGDDRSQWGQPTVRLAGDAPVPVRGFLLNPTSTLDPDRYLGEFEVDVSIDGETFETVLRAHLSPRAAEQAFVLPESVPARFVRLKPLSSVRGDASSHNNVQLGQFKVVAEPGWRPSTAPFNLADRANGGRMVYGRPWIRGSAFDTGVLIDDDEAPAPRLGGETGATLVLGFEHGRAARIDSIEIDPAEAHADNPEAVRAFVTTESPVGPWREVAAAELGEAPTTLALEEPAWARYVRLVFDLPESAISARYPDQVEVFEAVGPSVLGEWGNLASIGPWEASNTPAWQGLEGAPPNDAAERALLLAEGTSAPGRALLDRYSSWYRLEVPEDRNQVTLTVSGYPTVEAGPRLIDGDGNPVTLYPVGRDSGPDRLTWQTWVEPGSSYLLEIEEPPRSVIFSWDTSGSVAAWLPIISNALFSYAETIRPGRDEVNLLPFGQGRPLLKNWQGHPYPLMRMLVAYPRETSSSAAEATLAVAAREMVRRPGKKAVLFLTDAATSTVPELWPALSEGRPQVFAMKLSSVGAFGGDPQIEVDLMQDWARVRGGHFEYVTGFGSIARGFDRAVARLKRPVDFAVAAEYAAVDDPSPASLAVVFDVAGDAEASASMRGAVEIILDASGSMLKRMDGTRRIDIARNAIRATVENTLPAGLPIALRVYGHREAGSCRTDLEIPLAPLDKAAFLGQVDGIQAINLARTPIADSLRAVSSDLSEAEGRKLVVLLTDGEETCEGDPAEAIAALQEAGLDVRVNIVGFAIDDEALKQQFMDWATLGGGTYLDAGEAGDLEQAMRRALSVPFRVLDAAGEIIASGRVGDAPVEVPPGRYTVVIQRGDGDETRRVELAPGDARVIELQ